MNSRNPPSTSAQNSRPHSTDSGKQSYLFHIFQTLGRIEGKLDGHLSSKKDSNLNLGALIMALLPAIPGVLVIILAALGKLPWSTAATALIGSSGR